LLTRNSRKTSVEQYQSRKIQVCTASFGIVARNPPLHAKLHPQRSLQTVKHAANPGAQHAARLGAECELHSIANRPASRAACPTPAASFLPHAKITMNLRDSLATGKRQANRICIHATGGFRRWLHSKPQVDFVGGCPAVCMVGPCADNCSPGCGWSNGYMCGVYIRVR